MSGKLTGTDAIAPYATLPVGLCSQPIQIKGNVVSVESYTEYSHYSYKVFQQGWPKVYHQWDTVGSDRPYHYLGSGAFFVRLGDSFANAMADLMAE